MAGILVAEPHEVNVEARRRSRRDGRLGSPAKRSGRLLPRNLSPPNGFGKGTASAVPLSAAKDACFSP